MSSLATPHEQARAKKQAIAVRGHQTQVERCNGFGGNALTGLSKKGRALLAKTTPSIPIEPSGSGIKRHFKAKASI